MKLSDEVLEEGRNLIREMNLDGIVLWVERNVPMDLKVFRNTYEIIFKYKDVEKGLRLFNRVFSDLEVESRRETILS